MSDKSLYKNRYELEKSDKIIGASPIMTIKFDNDNQLTIKFDNDNQVLFVTFLSLHLW